MQHGAQCVMTYGALLMLMLPADNLDSHQVVCSEDPGKIYSVHGLLQN